MTAREGNMVNCHTEKITLVFEVWQLPMLPSRAVNIYYIILNISVIKSIHLLHYFWFQIQVKWIFVFVFSTPYAHKFCAVDIFLEYHPSSNNITRCQVSSRVSAWLHDPSGDIHFYQMSLSQSESTFLHESII